MGYITQAIAVNLAPILFIIFQTQYSISLEQLGALVSINFGVQIVSDVIATKYVDKIGYRPALLAAAALGVIGLTMLSILPNVMDNAFLALILANVVYAWGSGLIEVLISPVVESLPGDAKASAMSLLHAFYCWGFLLVVGVSTLALHFFGRDIWTYLPIAWAIVPLICFFMFLKVPLNKIPSEDTDTPIRNLLKNKAFFLAMLLMICSGSTEQTMSQWSSLFAELGLGVPKVVGDLLGMSVFALFMGIGRTLFGLYGERVNLRKTLRLSAGLAIVCYGIAVFIHSPYLSLAGVALCGFAVALMWPGTLSLSAARFPLGGTAMFGILAICGDIGCAIGPGLVGYVSEAAQRNNWLMEYAARLGLGIEQMGLKVGLLVGIIFPIAMLIVLFLQKDGKTAKARESAAPVSNS